MLAMLLFHLNAGMKLAQKNREKSCLPDGKLGRRVTRLRRRDSPSLFNLRQTSNLLKRL